MYFPTHYDVRDQLTVVGNLNLRLRRKNGTTKRSAKLNGL